MTDHASGSAKPKHKNRSFLLVSGILLAVTIVTNILSSGMTGSSAQMSTVAGRLSAAQNAVQARAAILQSESSLHLMLTKSPPLVRDLGIGAAREATKSALSKVEMLPAAQKEVSQSIGQVGAPLRTIRVSAELARDDDKAPPWVKNQAIQIIESVGVIATSEGSLVIEAGPIEKALSVIRKAQVSSRSDITKDIDAIDRTVGKSLEKLKSIVPSDAENSAVLKSVSNLSDKINQSIAATLASKFVLDWVGGLSSVGLFIVIAFLASVSTAESQSVSKVVGYGNREAITRLTDDVRRIAGGDLSRDAITSEPSTQQVAMELNNAIDNWRSTVEKMTLGAAFAGEKAASAQESAEKIRHRSERQSREVTGALLGVKKVTETTSGIAKDSLASEFAAKTALEAVYNGSRAVRATTDSMRLIREGIQQNETRVKRLGERSLEIDAITDILSSVFEQINVLAVNASVEGARAGEVGRRFLVVAREIQLLSDQTEKALGKISVLVRTIRAETNQVGDMISISTKKAKEGESIAQMAGASLEVIEAVTRSLAGMAEHISESTRDQLDQAEHASRSIEGVMELAQEILDSTLTVTTQVGEIGGSMKKINESVRGFRTGSAKVTSS